MSDPTTSTALVSGEKGVTVSEARKSFSDLRQTGVMQSLLGAGLPLSELADPNVQRALVDATMLDTMLHATKETVNKVGDVHVTVDYKERRTAAVQLSKMKGYDAGADTKRNRVLDEVDKLKRFLASKEIIVEKVEP